MMSRAPLTAVTLKVSLRGVPTTVALDVVVARLKVSGALAPGSATRRVVADVVTTPYVWPPD